MSINRYYLSNWMLFRALQNLRKNFVLHMVMVIAGAIWSFKTWFCIPSLVISSSNMVRGIWGIREIDCNINRALRYSYTFSPRISPSPDIIPDDIHMALNPIPTRIGAYYASYVAGICTITYFDLMKHISLIIFAENIWISWVF